MFCSNCGKELVDGSNFCPNCGQKVVSASDGAFSGKDFTNQKISANLWRNEVSFGGHLFFSEKSMRFASHSINIGQCNVEIFYADILKVEFVNYYGGIVPTGLQITTKDNSVYRFVVWKRKDVKAFLDYKASHV